MSQSNDWYASAAQAQPQPPTDQAYQPTGPAYQPPQTPNGYPPAPYQQPYPAGGYQQPTQIVPKNAGVALLISFFLPGVGSMYAGKTTTGVIILIGYIISWFLIIILIGWIGIFGFWLWGMIDSYQGAQAWNRARGIES
jgi:TM2 domain-containing membrane protein YozV